MRRKHVGEVLQEKAREVEADLDASREEGRLDVAAYRQVCLRLRLGLAGLRSGLPSLRCLRVVYEGRYLLE